MAQQTKEALKEKGLVRIQVIVPEEMEKLMRILGDKLKKGELQQGSIVRLE